MHTIKNVVDETAPQPLIVDMLYDDINKKFICPRCGHSHVRIKPGVFVDMYICEDCDLESRTLKVVKSNLI